MLQGKVMARNAPRVEREGAKLGVRHSLEVCPLYQIPMGDVLKENVSSCRFTQRMGRTSPDWKVLVFWLCTTQMRISGQRCNGRGDENTHFAGALCQRMGTRRYQSQACTRRLSLDHDSRLPWLSGPSSLTSPPLHDRVSVLTVTVDSAVHIPGQWTLLSP